MTISPRALFDWASKEQISPSDHADSLPPINPCHTTFSSPRPQVCPDIINTISGASTRAQIKFVFHENRSRQVILQLYPFGNTKRRNAIQWLTMDLKFQPRIKVTEGDQISSVTLLYCLAHTSCLKQKDLLCKSATETQHRIKKRGVSNTKQPNQRTFKAFKRYWFFQPWDWIWNYMSNMETAKYISLYGTDSTAEASWRLTAGKPVTVMGKGYSMATTIEWYITVSLSNVYIYIYSHPHIDGKVNPY